MFAYFNEEEKSKVYGVVFDRFYLEPIFTSTLKIPEQLKYYDENLFVVFNQKKQRYELHSLESYYLNNKDWSTYQMTIGKNLDHFEVERLYLNDIKKHGQSIFNDVDDFNNMLEESNAKTEEMLIGVASQKVVDYISGSGKMY